MARRKEIKEEVESKPEASKYQLVNKTEAILSVPYINAEGKKIYFNLRIQGKGSKEGPPVIEEWNITPEMKALEKRGLISLVKTN